MLARRFRISRKTFKQFGRPEKRAENDFFKAVCFVHPILNEVGLSAIVAKKTAKSSPLRHRLKRLTYAMAEPYILKIKRGKAILIYPKVSLKEVPFLIGQQRILEIFKALDML